MLDSQEVLLNTIPGGSENDRLAVILCHTNQHGSMIELHQQSWGEGVGWFTQSKVVLDSGQVAQLSSVLGSSTREPCRVRVPASWTPRVVSADSA